MSEYRKVESLHLLCDIYAVCGNGKEEHGN